MNDNKINSERKVTLFRICLLDEDWARIVAECNFIGVYHGMI